MVRALVVVLSAALGRCSQSAGRGWQRGIKHGAKCGGMHLLAVGRVVVVVKRVAGRRACGRLAVAL